MLESYNVAQRVSNILFNKINKDSNAYMNTMNE